MLLADLTDGDGRRAARRGRPAGRDPADHGRDPADGRRARPASRRCRTRSPGRSGAYSVLVIGPAVPELAQVVPAIGKGVLGRARAVEGAEAHDQLPRRRLRARRRSRRPTRRRRCERLREVKRDGRPGRRLLLRPRLLRRAQLSGSWVLAQVDGEPGPDDQEPDHRAHSGSRTPGLQMPCGSSRCLTARSTSTPSGPISRSIQGRWSAPTAWWWVSVPPAPSSASVAARFAVSHCWIGSVVVPVGEHGHVQRGAGRVAVRDVAHDQRTPSVAGQRLPQRPADGVVDGGQRRPGGRRLQRLDQQAAVHEPVAQVGPVEPVLLPRLADPRGPAGSPRRPAAARRPPSSRARTIVGSPSQPSTSRQPSPWPRVRRLPRSSRAPGAGGHEQVGPGLVGVGEPDDVGQQVVPRQLLQRGEPGRPRSGTTSPRSAQAAGFGRTRSVSSVMTPSVALGAQREAEQVGAGRGGRRVAELQHAGRRGQGQPGDQLVEAADAGRVLAGRAGGRVAAERWRTPSSAAGARRSAPRGPAPAPAPGRACPGRR